MKNKFIAVLFFLSGQLIGQGLDGDKISTNKGDLIIKPVLHGTLAVE